MEPFKQAASQHKHQHTPFIKKWNPEEKIASLMQYWMLKKVEWEWKKSFLIVSNKKWLSLLLIEMDANYIN